MRISRSSRWLIAAAMFCMAMTPAVQAATVTGVVVNGLTGQPVRGAEMKFEGTEVTATSDLDGLVLVQLPPGTYAVTITKDEFQGLKLTDIAVTDAGGDFAAVLNPVAGSGAGEDVSFGETITVSTEAGGSSEAALLAERKGAIQISDSIGSEEMSKNTGSDAAGVLKRVTGISLQDNKYVFVRGLGDRYSSTSLNGSKIPSTEFEKKVIPLDLFPAELIEKITVSKSYTVDKPGDFAAGLVELSTVEFPSQQTGSIGFSLGWNGETTGDDWLEYPGGVDFFGGGGQPLPGGIPADDLTRFSPFSNTGFPADELEEFGELLVGSWRPLISGSAQPNGSIKGTYGNTFNDGRLGFVVTGTYENSRSTRDEDRNFFRLGRGGIVEPDSTYRFDYTDEKVRQALTGNLAYRFGDNHHIQFRSLLTTLTEAEGRFQEGFFSDVSEDINDFRVSFLEQEITNFQLTGDHYWNDLGDGGLLEWRASVSEATTEENRRQALYVILDGEPLYREDSQSGFMYWNDLTDDVNDIKVDWTSFFTGDKLFGSVKAGVAHTANERDFFGRRLRFFTRGTSGIDFTAPPEELFIDDNIRPNGFEIQEATRATDSYNGNWDIPAAYIQADIGWGKWRVIGGVRVEDSDQEVITFDRNDPDNPPLITELADTDVLPSLSLVYKLTEDSNLRFSASQTVNRPEYRELAPFEFTHIVGGFTAVGNPELVRAKITSFDARWEWFPSANEVLAASIFYKDFEDPIEKLILGGSLSFETFTNVEGAENLGFELEARKNLGTLLGGAFENVNLIFNYAFVESEITIDPTVSAVTNDQRALIGQPDNVANLIIDWANTSRSSGVRLLYNFVDDKVAFAGGFGLPDIIEESRNTIDVVWSQSLDRWAKGLRFKLSGSNLLDEERLWTQGGGTFRLYDPGISVGASFSYDLFAR
ncbi:MAG: TonB-dependent receptor [Acidobacteriota bacterium]